MITYAAAETVLVTALAAQFPAARVLTETPANLVEVLPCIQVTRFGGVDDVLSFDEATLDVDVYAATRDDARSLGEQVRGYLRGELPGQTVAGAFVLRVRTLSAPSWTPHTNTGLRRFTSSYQIRLHSIQ